ncbi:MAG: cysteine--tRNA ligase [Spirochaetota bacterium]|nr:cysteine--tRNA ligase [Spirochaetota bacterium]
MTLKIHNTLTGIKEELIPQGEKKEKIEDYPPVTIYSCGPTVHNYAHIGNFRTFIFSDLLRRYLKFRGFKVINAMNITDVDDKTIAGARDEGITLKEYTEKYIEIFFQDLKTLNIESVEHTPRATESIDAMIDIMSRLEKKGITYKMDGSLYFSISKFPKYGKLSRLDKREIQSGLRYDTDEYEKDDVRDFALWKTSKENEPYWDTPWGKGRPGWHIECSAMVRRIFGKTIDIHTGGVDLIFPHHENEIAQSEAAYDETFVRYWLHAEHLLVEGAKMSKSEGNFYTLRDLINKGYSPRAIRYLLISSHYKKQLNFTFEGLNQAANALSRIDNLIIRLQEIQEGEADQEIKSSIKSSTDDFTSRFVENMDNDLNIAGGIGIFFEFVHEINSLIDDHKIDKNDTLLILEALKKIDSILGFIFFPESETDEINIEKIEKLIEERLEAKRNKDYNKADEIREMLLNDGIILEDKKDGTRWKRKK